MTTDTQLKQDVLAELDWEPSVNATQIGIEVKNGIVTLVGHVASYAAKWDAERAAQHVSGVKALVVKMDDVSADGLRQGYPETAHIPIIALSANALAHDVARGMEAGFFRYITKPLKLKEFIEALDAALEFAETASPHGTEN
ncbi:MAG: BON domain-containing protein [Sulfuritalea sp.]|nr:BON domain-containing protein [Sulfuritalea sp.]